MVRKEGGKIVYKTSLYIPRCILPAVKLPGGGPGHDVPLDVWVGPDFLARTPREQINLIYEMFNMFYFKTFFLLFY